MELGLMVEPQVGGSYAELLAIARAAEAAGFESFARSDHYLNGEDSAPATDALATLAGLGRDTDTIKLSVLVTPLTFRHPAVIVKTAATIDEMSGGRFELGIGTGWMEAEHRVFDIDLPDIRTRFSLLFETLTYAHAAFGRTEGGFSGRHWTLEDIPILPRPTGKLPIIIGGSGMKRTPALAGRFADEYNMFACDAPTLATRRAIMRSAATDLGRDPDSIKISMAGPVVVGADAAEYRDRLGAEAAAGGSEPAELEEMYRSRRIPHGTIEQAAAMMRTLRAEGVGRFYIQHFRPLGDIDTEEFPGLVAGLSG